MPSPGHARWRLDIAYDGSDFHGWARQPGVRTVESVITDALTTITAATTRVDVTCAGRTDAGVHARGQVAHVDLPEDDRGLDEAMLLRRLQGVLPDDIAVTAARTVSADFDARFSAVWRRYAYRIADSHAARDPLRRTDVLDHPRSLDLEAMNAAAACLLGEHDFAAFCRARDGGTTIRRILDCDWSRDEAGRAVLDIRADAFCHSMVRSVVGALIAVGDGRREPEWVGEVLHRGTRDTGVRVMPAHGLTLEEVGYPPPQEWAARQEVTRVLREESAEDDPALTGNDRSR